MENTTIAAISTPTGEGGIGVIRISGNNAERIADKVFKSFSGKKISELKGYTALYGKIVNNLGETLDEAIALFFKAPKSYTGENVVELSLHGGMYVLRAALRELFSAGAVPAEAGEFTRRAFLNGKLDLIKAESVMGIISAGGKIAQRAALSLHEGTASAKINVIKQNLLTAAAGLTVYSDYPDDELPEFSEETLTQSLTFARDELSKLIEDYDAGRALTAGIDTVIAGRPNVGKSTLMNLLSGTKRSIVTSVAGTTRDVVENTVKLVDMTLNLSDTAGLRSTQDAVEKIGVDISRRKIESAGLIIAVFDGSSAPDAEDLKLIEICKNRPSVAVLNKSDLKAEFPADLLAELNRVVISAEKGDGLRELEKAVAEVCGANRLSGNEILLCSERQRECCVKACEYASEALCAMQSGVTLDAVGVCIDDAVNELLSLTGEKATDAVINEVFSKFCVGK